jgi:gamma-glutamylcyclotransferase (GGCT)/AIG2-like uncharacterized protein YtfP
VKVFVYGTLKKGFGNHGVLGDAKFICEDRTRYPYIMMDAGFPVVMDTPPAGKSPNDVHFVTGEVYEIPDDVYGRGILRNLDGLEGEGRMYHRKVTLTDSGHMVSMYFGDEDCWSRHDRSIEKSRRVKVEGENVSYVKD